jgi:nitric oxide reductase NorQ protein
MLIHTGRLVRSGLSLKAAIRSGIVLPITDDADIRAALSAAAEACLP